MYYTNCPWLTPNRALLTPDGDKPIEQFRPGHVILSRPENDCNAPVEVQVVEETFVRVAPVLTLLVGGQTIRTTGEHPFYVRHRGWVSAKELQPGDKLHSHDGRWIEVEEVSELDEVTTVHNLRVSENHTYFVGAAAWGFSVWAHNAEYDFFVHEGAYYLRNADGMVFRSPYQTLESLQDGMAAAGQSLRRLANAPTPDSILRAYRGGPPAGMHEPHAHHILFQQGHGAAQQALVQEGQAILRRQGIDPLFGPENLYWAPNRVNGQHHIDALRNVVETLRRIENEGGTYRDFVEALEELGRIAASRR